MDKHSRILVFFIRYTFFLLLTSSPLALAPQLHHPGECVVFILLLQQSLSLLVVLQKIYIVASDYLRIYRYTCGATFDITTNTKKGFKQQRHM